MRQAGSVRTDRHDRDTVIDIPKGRRASLPTDSFRPLTFPPPLPSPIERPKSKSLDKTETESYEHSKVEFSQPCTISTTHIINIPDNSGIEHINPIYSALRYTRRSSEIASSNGSLDRDKHIETRLHEFQLLIEELKQRSKRAEIKACGYKMLNVLISILIIVIACTVGVSSVVRPGSELWVTIGSFTIVGLKGFYELFKVGHRGIYFKFISIRFRKFLQDARLAMFNVYTTEEVIRYISLVRCEIDEIELASYKMSYGPTSIHNPAEVTTSNKGTRAPEG